MTSATPRYDLEIQSTDDMIDVAKTQAQVLDDIATTVVRDRDPAIKDVVTQVAAVATRLAEQLRDFVKDLRAVQRRRLAGLLIGFEGQDGKRWYICHAANLGSIVRTADPEYAMLFESLVELEAYLDSLKTSKGRDAKGKRWPAPLSMLSGKKLIVFKVRVEVEASRHSYQIPNFQIGR